MVDDNRVEDILGFTRQTHLLITGLGGTPDVIEEFRKRNISCDELAELNEFDLIRLGADYKLISAFLTQLKAAPRKSGETLTLQHRFNHLIEVVKSGQNHLDLIAAFIAYARLRLAKEQINFFVEADKSLRASQALKIASTATLEEVYEIKKELRNLKNYISTMDEIPEKKTYLNVYMAVGGLGLTACLLMHLCKNCYIQIN